jgi:lysozyme
MKPRLKSSPAARDLIKRFEPFHEAALRGSDGRWVVGYGHHAAARQGVTLSRDEASLLLIHDAMQAETAIAEICGIALNVNQLDALVSFVHSVETIDFRRSDVARYLYEGRAQAAGEAIAAYGDFDTERREAESMLFLTVPASGDVTPTLVKQKAATVEVHIQVEHASQAAALPALTEGEPTIGLSETSAPPDLPVPPPPMPLISAGKIQAENEIARILAAAQAIPQSNEVPGVQSSPGTKSDFDEPDTASTETDPDSAEKPVIPGTPAPRKRQVVSAPLDTLLASRARFVPQPETREAEDTETSETSVQPVEPAPASAETETNIGQSEPVSPETVEISETGSELNSAPPEVDVVDEAMASFAPEADTLEDVDESDAAPTESDPLNSPTDQLVARMAQQISDIPVIVEDPHAGSSQNEFADSGLPDGVAVGYVLAGGMMPATTPEPVLDSQAPTRAEKSQGTTADLPRETEAQSSDVDTELAELAAAMVDPEPTVDATGSSADNEPVLPTADEAETTADNQSAEEVTFEPVFPEIVESPHTVSGDDTPPPHPSHAPATTEGAVGDVIASDDVENDVETSKSDTDLQETDSVPFEDDFSPQDLTGGAEPYVDQDLKVENQNSTGMGFVLVFVAGAFLAAFGAWDASAQWGAIWASKNLTMGAYMALGGIFLMIVSGWMFVSDFLAHRKQSAKT